MRELIIKHSNIFSNLLKPKFRKCIDYHQESIPVLYRTKETKSKEKYKLPLLCYENFGYDSIDELQVDLFLKKDKINLKLQFKNDNFYKNASLDHYALLGNISNGSINKDVNSFTRQCKLLLNKNKDLQWHKKFKSMIDDFVELSTTKDEKYRIVKPTIQMSILKNTEKELSENAAVAIIQEYNKSPYVVIAVGSFVDVCELESNSSVQNTKAPFMKGKCSMFEQYVDDCIFDEDDDYDLFNDL